MNESSRNSAWILTYTGIEYHPFDPRPEMVEIEDIAQSLSQTCRWRGHCKEFYSVAQHSVIVSELVDEKYALEGLLHDAAEAYTADVPAPIKRHSPDMIRLDDLNTKVISDRFDLIYPIPDQIHKVDEALRYAEAMELFNGIPYWADTTRARGNEYLKKCWKPEEAKYMFLIKFENLIRIRDEL